MLRFGIYTNDQYIRKRGCRTLRSGISYCLLDIGDNPTAQQKEAFDDINGLLQTSNGVFRKSFRRRFQDVDSAALRILKCIYKPEVELHVQDRAASHCLTSSEWAEQLFHHYMSTEFEASDTLLYLLKLSLANGEIYITEPSGEPLQYIKPPFVVALCGREAFRYPFNHLIAARAKRRFRRLRLPDKWISSERGEGYRVDKICCIHPEARDLNKRDPRFQIRLRSVFDPSPDVDVLRTMNIFNRAYFSSEQLIEGARIAFQSIRPGGIWIVGRTLEKDLTNHVTFLRRDRQQWEILERLGSGSEMEEFATLASTVSNREGAFTL